MIFSRSTILLSAVLLVAAGMAPARAGDAKIETLPATPMEDPSDAAESSAPASTGPAAFKLAMQDATLQQAVEAAAREWSIAITVPPEGSRGMAGPMVVYDVNVNAPVLDEALDQLGKALRLGILRSGETYRLGVGYEPGYRSGASRSARTALLGPPSARLESLTVQRWVTKGPPASDSLQLQLRVEPGALGTWGPAEVTVGEAVDEQGRSLVASSDPNQRFRPARQLMRSQHVSVPLALLSPPSTQISTFRATVKLAIPETVERLTIDGIDDNRVYDVNMGGIPLKIGPLTQNEQGNWSLPIQAPPEAVENSGEQKPAFDVGQAIQEMRLTGPAGETLRISMEGGRRVQERWWQFQTRIYPIRQTAVRSATRPATRPTTPRPTRLTWQIVKTTKTLELPVEGKDLVIP